MPVKTSKSGHERPAASLRERKPRSSETAPEVATVDEDELVALVLRACLIARDAVYNVREAVESKSRLALLAIKDCEKELDQIERRIDEQLPQAITRVGEAKARELLACLKFITDLERIGDLALSAVMQLQPRREKLPPADSKSLMEMAVAMGHARGGASGISEARSGPCA